MFGPSVSLEVKLEGAALPPDLPVRLGPMCGNQGARRLGYGATFHRIVRDASLLTGMGRLISAARTKPSVHVLLSFSIVLLTATLSSHGHASSGDAELRAGQRCEVVGPLYAHGVTDDLGSKKISLVSVVPLRLSGPEIVFRRVVPIGSLLTIVGEAPRKPLQFLYPARYIAQISELDAPAGVPVVIDLSRGIEGKPNMLNPEIFRPLPAP